ncbi:XRE family transcriptional regulator [Ottowia sp. GY511]|uniref:XRE family transcriptional regulator n=1 Tax=Ottowia flava TaxID=2675430 RepID=A0ABW4KMH5_9BURK|nr:XRE family transcriptional regulator [Ottowia sp. GY511]TXK26386.1 XRE family transcriptional regulator [Ottowia sp. GY511]
MERLQKELALLGRLDAPSVAPIAVVTLARTYRDAVRLAWARKRVHYATQRQLAAETGMPPQHVSDYLHTDDGPTRRDLPAWRIPEFEAFVGNTIVSQWLALQARLTVLEELQASRLAA